MSKKDFWLTTLFRHQLTGGIAYVIDFSVLVALTELLDLWYVASTAIAGLVGAFHVKLLGI